MHNFSFLNFIDRPYFFSYNTDTVGFIFDDMILTLSLAEKSFTVILSSKITNHRQLSKNHNIIATLETLHR